MGKNKIQKPEYWTIWLDSSLWSGSKTVSRHKTQESAESAILRWVPGVRYRVIKAVEVARGKTKRRG